MADHQPWLRLRAVLILSSVFLISIPGYTQENPFPYGRVTYVELEMKSYPKDTTASAVVLQEMGETHISDEFKLVLDYHVKIKILRKDGYKYANFSIPLYRDKKTGDEEKWVSLQASSYNITNGSLRETKFDPKEFYLDKTSESISRARFAIPDVREGSVIEVKYVLESPFIFNWRTWQFQSDIPKVKSEYWAKIPGNYLYNVTLRGFQKLSKNESTLVHNCFEPGGGRSADCSFSKYAMEDIPAFVEEDYMTAKSNFLSAINFELTEVKYFDGTSKKYTEEWKDVDNRLREEPRFGGQIKKARSIFDDKVAPLEANDADSLKKAKAIYDYVRGWYTWNGNNSLFSELEIRKAFESKQGNVADINLSLVGALQSAGFNAAPVMLSTRENGLPIQLHPVLSDFNYVIAYVKLGGQAYLLDATEKFTPFGVLPIRCLNDKGRLISRKESGWVDLKTKEKQKKTTSLTLKLMEDGKLTGQLTFNSYGYDAIDKREAYAEAGGDEAYFKKIQKKYSDAELSNYTIENVTDLNKPVIEKMDIEIPDEEGGNTETLFFNPFLFGTWNSNPFKSNERNYPVDLGAAMEITFLLTLELPINLKVDEAPANVALALPQGGGRFLVNVNNQENKVGLSCVVALNKALYNSTEYHYLKEFFARVIQTQQSQFVFKKK